MNDGADRIGGQPALLIDHIADRFIDRDGKAVIIGPDPQAAFRINIKTVYIADFIIIIHPAEFAAVIAVQSGICTDPEDPVIGLCNIIRFSAGETVFRTVYCLDIIVVIRTGFRNFILGFSRAVMLQQNNSQKKRKDVCCRAAF